MRGNIIDQQHNVFGQEQLVVQRVFFTPRSRGRSQRTCGPAPYAGDVSTHRSGWKEWTTRV